MSILINKISESFTMLPNEVITDTTISDKAFRILAYLFTKPSGWEVNNQDIMTKLRIKQDATIAAAWRQLISAGWIKRARKHGKGGKLLGGYDYELILPADRTVVDPQNGDRTVGQPEYGTNHSHSKTEFSNNTKSSSSQKNNKKVTKPDLQEDVDVIVKLMNDLAGTKYKSNSKNTDFIRARLKDYTVDDCIDVVFKKYEEWKDTAMMKYFRITTLFNATKFEEYYSAPTIKNTVKTSKLQVNSGQIKYI